ncbi:MAG: hypothetical protein WCY97_07110 [Methanothrix sp.]|jgi:hypothetical protein|uniref:Uncharacterized protein n=1 Tax=Methanothrix harundinacea TaxID=301375 RepID=A0A101IJL2_9EURY|nr:MAG: hypothetical protein APR56_08410 [Methanosaeta sp. SDB]KUK43986.1 MAG: hypothetical protein XD72_1625 [Methanothrix harundinacea]MDD2637499.1 hypothetical protein [Methanothrix sp.]MDI9399078.1 hypothetical protein [Euryarchaeota archaeon]KUK96455.1 MAG: hypothetical protein XE07_1126 [Methanothrix harundinacea]
MISEERSRSEENLDRTLREAAEGYGDLMAISVVHHVSMKALRSRWMELQIKEQERIKMQEKLSEEAT